MIISNDTTIQQQITIFHTPNKQKPISCNKLHRQKKYDNLSDTPQQPINTATTVLILMMRIQFNRKHAFCSFVNDARRM